MLIPAPSKHELYLSDSFVIELIIFTISNRYQAMISRLFKRFTALVTGVASSSFTLSLQIGKSFPAGMVGPEGEQAALGAVVLLPARPRIGDLQINPVARRRPPAFASPARPWTRSGP